MSTLLNAAFISRDPLFVRKNEPIGKLYDQWVPTNVRRVEVSYDHMRGVTIVHWTNSESKPQHMDLPHDESGFPDVTAVIVAMRLSC